MTNAPHSTGFSWNQAVTTGVPAATLTLGIIGLVSTVLVHLDNKIYADYKDLRGQIAEVRQDVGDVRQDLSDQISDLKTPIIRTMGDPQ